MPPRAPYRTVIHFSLDRPSVARLTLYDRGGNRVRELAFAHLEQGDHQVVWDGRDDGGVPVPSGRYSACLVARGELLFRTIIEKNG